MENRARSMESLVIVQGSHPLISILIPNYNYKQYVNRAVESALAQDYPAIEVVVCDNKSTDGAWELLQEHFGQNTKVRLYQNDTNIGMARNFDRVLSLARGDYILCLSSDDFLLPSHVSKLAQRFFQYPQLDVVYCNAYLAHEDGTPYMVRAMAGQFPVDYVDARDELVEEFTTVCPVCFPCALFRREALLENELWDGRDYVNEAGDWELIIRLALAGKKFAYIAQPSMVIRLHSDQFSGDRYHRAGNNVLDFVAYVERYMNHPAFLDRMRGRELGIARLIQTLVNQAVILNGGSTPFSQDTLNRFQALVLQMEKRGLEYERQWVYNAKVSIVIQHAGAVRPLFEALDSIMAQTYTNWEVILVDHSSIPVEALVQTHPTWAKMSYIRLPGTQAPGVARNLGLRMIKGQFVAFLESDSRFLPTHLESMLASLRTSGKQIAIASAQIDLEVTNGSASIVQQRLGGLELSIGPSEFGHILIAHTVPLECLLIYRGILDRVGRFNETLPILDDWDFLIKLFALSEITFTQSTSAIITARIGFIAQRMGPNLSHYLPVLDALYKAYPVTAKQNEVRKRHRAMIAALMNESVQLVSQPQGLRAVMTIFMGKESLFQENASGPKPDINYK
jgi:O-antigen biosynthesis protein